MSVGFSFTGTDEVIAMWSHDFSKFTSPLVGRYNHQIWTAGTDFGKEFRRCSFKGDNDRQGTCGHMTMTNLYILKY